MSYYTDLDDDLGAEEEAERQFLEAEKEAVQKCSELAIKRKKKASGGKVTVRGRKVTVHCAYCTQEFLARVADRERGWGEFCSKSCAARSREMKWGGSTNLATINLKTDDLVEYIKRYAPDIIEALAKEKCGGEQ